jgi:hypothetical protein
MCHGTSNNMRVIHEYIHTLCTLSKLNAESWPAGCDKAQAQEQQEDQEQASQRHRYGRVYIQTDESRVYLATTCTSTGTYRLEYHVTRDHVLLLQDKHTPTNATQPINPNRQRTHRTDTRADTLQEQQRQQRILQERGGRGDQQDVQATTTNGRTDGLTDGRTTCR